MGDFYGNVDISKLISYSDDLVAVLKEKRDIKILTQCLDHSKSLRSSCTAEFNTSLNLLQDYEKKKDEYKAKTEKANVEISSDTELEILENELEEEREKERVLMEELRVINDELNDLERQRILVEEQRESMKKLEKEELKAWRKLSMYASVTNIIPNLDNHSKISGRIVDREKDTAEKFEYDPTTMATFDTCQNIWKMIDLR